MNKDKTDKKIEEILVECQKWGVYSGEVDYEDIKHHLKELNTEVQKQVEDGVRGFVEWLGLDEGGKGMYLKADAEQYLKERENEETNM